MPFSVAHPGGERGATGGHEGRDNLLGVAALRSIIAGAAGAEFATLEKQRAAILKSAIGDTLRDLVDVLRRGGDAATDASTIPNLIRNATDAIFAPCAAEVKATFDAQLRLRKAELQMDFMAGQIARRDELAAAQRREMLKQLSLSLERAYTLKEANNKLLLVNRALKQRIANYAPTPATTLGSVLHKHATESLASVASTTFDAADENFALEAGASVTSSLVHPGTGVDATVLAAQMDDEWSKIRLAEESAAREDAIRRDAEQRLKDQQARHKHEEQRIEQRSRRRVDEAVRAEGVRLESRVRQLEYQLRKKENEIEATLTKERAKWMGSNATNAAAAESQLRMLRKRWAAQREKLLMQIHDERSTFGVAYSTLQEDGRRSLWALQEQLNHTTAAKDRLSSMLGTLQAATRVEAGADNAKARAQLLAQVKAFEEENERLRAAGSPSVSGAASPKPQQLLSHGDTQQSPSSPRAPPPPKTPSAPLWGSDALLTPAAVASAQPSPMYGGGARSNSVAGAGTATPQAAQPAPPTTLRAEVGALEAKIKEEQDARTKAEASHREAIDMAVAEADALRGEVEAYRAQVAALKFEVEELSLEVNAVGGATEKRRRLAARSAALATVGGGSTGPGDQQLSATARYSSMRRAVRLGQQLESPTPGSGSPDGGAPAAADGRGTPRSESADHDVMRSTGRSGGVVSPSAMDTAPHHHRPRDGQRQQLAALCKDLMSAVTQLAGTDASDAAGGSARVPFLPPGVSQHVINELDRLLQRCSAPRSAPTRHSASSSPVSFPQFTADEADMVAELRDGIIMLLRQVAAAASGGAITHPHTGAAPAAVPGVIVTPRTSTTAPSPVLDQPQGKGPLRQATTTIGVHERSVAMQQHADVKRRALAAERRSHAEQVFQLSGKVINVTESSAGPTYPPCEGDGTTPRHDADGDGHVSNRGAVWIDLGEVIARAQRVLVGDHAARYAQLSDAEKASSRGRAVHRSMEHDIRFSVRSCGTQTVPIAICDLPYGFAFAPECFESADPTADVKLPLNALGSSRRPSPTRGRSSATTTDANYLVLLCNPMTQKLSAATLPLVAPPFVYDASAYFVPSEAEHVQRLSDFADQAMASIVDLLAKRGSTVVPEAVDPRFVYRTGDSTPHHVRVPSSTGTPRRVTPPRQHSPTNTNDMNGGVSRETLAMVYRHRDGRRNLTPRPPSARTERPSATAADIADAMQRAAAHDAAVRTIMTARPTTKASTADRSAGPRNLEMQASSDREPTPPPYRPLMMTHTPLPLAARNNPYAGLKTSGSRRRAVQETTPRS